MRPGEKLFEELSTDGEHILPTYHNKVKIFSTPGPGRDYVANWIEELRLLTNSRDEDDVLNHLAKLVPEYQPSRKRVRSGTKAAMAAMAAAGV